MKKVLVLALALGLFALPVMAQVEAGAGKITVHADVDFLGRFIAEHDDAEMVTMVGNTIMAGEVGQPQVEDFILRDAILSLQGELSDKVCWELTAQQFGLLTARIDLKLIPMTTITFGRFLVDQSPSLNYHIMSKVHTIYFPMAANAGANYGSSENLAGIGIVPMLVPGWQTGVQAQIGNEMVHLTLGWFNGNGLGGGAWQETDNSKAGLIGLHVNASGLIVGISYWDEYSNDLHYMFDTDDARLNILDIYLGYNHERFHVLAEYLSNNLDPLDTDMDAMQQMDWYIQGGVFLMENAEIVARYETLDLISFDDDDLGPIDDVDNETWITIGANYFLVDKNAVVSLQYIFKDHEDLEWNNNELTMLVEVDI